MSQLLNTDTHEVLYKKLRILANTERFFEFSDRMFDGLQIEVANAQLSHHIVHRSHGFIYFSFEFHKEIASSL